MHSLKRKIATLLLITVLTMIFAPAFAPTLTVNAANTTESTTEDDVSFSSNINDFDVGLDSNGNLTTSMDNDDTNSVSLWNWLSDKGKGILTGITSICTIICAGILIVACVKFSGSGSNAQARKSAITGILVGVIGVALLGGVTLIMALSWNFLG